MSSAPRSGERDVGIDVDVDCGIDVDVDRDVDRDPRPATSDPRPATRDDAESLLIDVYLAARTSVAAGATVGCEIEAVDADDGTLVGRSSVRWHVGSDTVTMSGSTGLYRLLGAVTNIRPATAEEWTVSLCPDP